MVIRRFWCFFFPFSHGQVWLWELRSGGGEPRREIRDLQAQDWTKVKNFLQAKQTKIEFGPSVSGKTFFQVWASNLTLFFCFFLVLPWVSITHVFFIICDCIWLCFFFCFCFIEGRGFILVKNAKNCLLNFVFYISSCALSFFPLFLLVFNMYFFPLFLHWVEGFFLWKKSKCCM